MKQWWLIPSIFLFIAVVVSIICGTVFSLREGNNLIPQSSESTSTVAVVSTSTLPTPTADIKLSQHSSTILAYNLFLVISATLQETGSMAESANAKWWLASGGYLYVASSGVASTILGPLPTNDPWRLLYNKNNPVDTNSGYYPQNIFRLVLRSHWQNYTEQTYFMIKANNLSASPNRNESNGLFLFNRYQSSATLYYAGLRIDGTAVIKKKIDGTYYTMAQAPIFPGTYSQTSTPNLLPMNEWMGLRSIVQTNSDRSVTVSLYTDIGKTGNWQEVLSAIDDGTKYGGAPITAAGYVGIRTDFMDVEFDDFQVQAL